MTLSYADRSAIVSAVKSYRRGAPMTLEDIRIACALDGHRIDHIDRRSLSHFVRMFCSVENGRNGIHDYRVYRWDGTPWEVTA